MAWVDAAGDSPIPWLVRGTHAIDWAWEARGGGPGETVGRERFAVFHERLDAAWSDLVRAVELDRADPTPWSHLIIVAMGLELDLDEKRRIFEEAVARGGEHRSAHAAYLGAICKKWDGSHEAMFGFARQASERNRDGRLAFLVAEAHLERWISFTFDNERESMNTYFGLPAVKQEVRRARDRAFARGQRRMRWQEVVDRNLFAFCFWMSQDQHDAEAALEAVGDDLTRYPWRILGQPEGVFANARLDVFGKQ
ncbi:MAG: hypothetical protein U0166_15335 [Acidobacteriota bacterium]